MSALVEVLEDAFSATVYGGQFIRGGARGAEVSAKVAYYATTSALESAAKSGLTPAPDTLVVKFFVSSVNGPGATATVKAWRVTR